jgi:hypothetical protein
LSAWEEGASQSSPARALLLLSRAWPERSYDEWAGVAIGERDAYLLRLREQAFGSRLETVTVCPKCGQRLELSFGTADIRVAAPDPAASLHVETGGYRVLFRLPTTADLLAAAEAPSTDAHEALFRRCIESAEHRGGTVDPGALPAEVKQAVIAGMAEADPQADLRVETTCAACSHTWPVAFDIVSYLWSEIEDWARRLVRDVHALASAYGWSERDIFALSPGRRRLYLEMVGG